MTKGFHDREFDDATQLKLAIFRGYIRKWIPVFLTARRAGPQQHAVNIFDFFAGPGTDSAGNPGSPRIIQEELRGFCESRSDVKAVGLRVNLYFNDNEPDHVDQLQQCLAQNACSLGCCQAKLSCLPFQECLASNMPVIQADGSANLVILDQFGLKEVTPEVVNLLAQCRTTDILFFVSSSFIRRFADEPSIQNYFQLSAEELAASAYRSIHRHICDYFRSRLSVGNAYHLAPFSIKKGSNIYGVIFGSSSLLGLQKFLEVCWDLDGTTGEANYDIDSDPIRYGQLSLFPEDNLPKKEGTFQRELEAMLYASTGAALVTNRTIYEFTLERGFLPRHANAYLMRLQEANRLEVTDVGSGMPARRRAFYLKWQDFQAKMTRATFRLRK